MWNLTFSIHDLLKIEVNVKGPVGLGAGLKYSYFETELNGDADIILNIGKFNPSNSGCSILSHKYHIKDNYFYCREKGKRGNWELEVFGFESGKTVINFNGKNSGIKGMMFPTFLSQEFLMPFIEYKLALQGCLLLHSGAISEKSGAFVLVGRMGSFKTTLIMDFIRRANFSYLGDDRIIMKGNRVLCFPTSLFLFNFMLSNNSTEHRSLINNFHLLYNIFKNNDSKDTHIISSANLKCLIFLSKTSNNEFNINELPSDIGIRKLVENNKLEMVSSMSQTPAENFYKYVLFYSIIFPDNSLATYWEASIRKLSEGLCLSPMYEACLPKKYSIDVYKKFYESIQGGFL